MIKLQPGINHVTNKEYHGDKEYLSSSDLKLILTEPAKFYKEKVLGQREEQAENASFSEGSLTHCLILEPEVLDTEFAFFDGLVKRGPDWESFKLANQGKTILSRPQKMRCKEFHAAYLRRPEAAQLISGGFAEHTICGEIGGIKIKVRTDYINVDKGYIADVKTSAFSVQYDSFKMTVDKYKYDLSAALYCMIAKQHYGKDFEFLFVAISKSDMECEVYRLSEASRQIGEQQIVAAIEKYKKCMATNLWTNNKSPAIIIESSDYEILSI